MAQANKIIIAGRNEARARQIAVRSSGEFILTNELLDHDIPVNVLINATTVSSREESSEYADIAEKLKLPQCELIFDLNYGRQQNFWQEKAQKNGIIFHDGLLNLIHQAKNSLSLWTGLEIETKEFRKALEDAV